MSSAVVVLTIPVLKRQYFMTTDEHMIVQDVLDLCNQQFKNDVCFFELYDVYHQCFLDHEKDIASMTKDGIRHVMLV